MLKAFLTLNNTPSTNGDEERMVLACVLRETYKYIWNDNIEDDNDDNDLMIMEVSFSSVTLLPVKRNAK